MLSPFVVRRIVSLFLLGINRSCLRKLLIKLRLGGGRVSSIVLQNSRQRVPHMASVFAFDVLFPVLIFSTNIRQIQVHTVVFQLMLQWNPSYQGSRMEICYSLIKINPAYRGGIRISGHLE